MFYGVNWWLCIYVNDDASVAVVFELRIVLIQKLRKKQGKMVLVLESLQLRINFSMSV